MPHRITLMALLLLLPAANWQAQQQSPAQPSRGAISEADRERALGILDGVSKGIQSLYYDPKMNGLDWPAVLAGARTKIAESNSLNEALAQIAVAVDTLHDSHTVFEPPARPYHLDFGFEYEMIWSLCFVTRVRPGSDAEAKGLKAGGQVLSINGTAPNRQNLRSIEYLDYVLNPRPEMQLEVQYPSGEKRKFALNAKVSLSPDLAYRPGAGVRYDVIRRDENVINRMRMETTRVGDVGIVKVPWFFYDAETFYALSRKIRKDRALIVDLRGDPGGAVDTLKYFVGMFFDHDVKLYDKVERKKTSPEIARRERPIYFPGKVIVLVDSGSATAGRSSSSCAPTTT